MCQKAALAQLAEHFISNEKVRGSTPRCGLHFCHFGRLANKKCASYDGQNDNRIKKCSNWLIQLY